MPNEENITNHKWQPGQSGNPKGRPKGFTGLTDTLRKMVESDGGLIVNEIYELDDEGKETGTVIKRGKLFIPKKDAIMLAAMRRAMKGDMRAIEFIADRLEGKAKQVVEFENDMPEQEKIDYTKLSTDVLRELANAIEKR